ncbi:hypothetical protein BDF14DRAFT_1872913 [Spinellus fusiger]|nr:hypothetical protein BDF14DRAFT_1872913 [Spinellus fusiger]
MQQRGIGFLARRVHAIPVVRPQDRAEQGHGRLCLLNPKTSPTTITGLEARFLSQLQAHDCIVLPKNVGKMQVARVVSDTELVVVAQVTEEKALQVLLRAEGTAYKCMPRVEQEAVYERVYDELSHGRCITIFPEGGSHDRAEMLPLKAGVTIMALGAMAKYPGLEVKIVPCGLNYFHAHRFRSRAVIEFGNPISIPSYLVDQFKQSGDQKREACSLLLDMIYCALKSVTVNVSNEQTLMVIQAARRLYKPAHRRMSIAQVVDLNRRLIVGYNLHKEDPEVVELQHKIMAYNQLLKYHGLQDHQVPGINLRGCLTLALLVYRAILFVLWGLVAFPGSSVKISGRDVLATWKLLVALVLLPTMYTLYTIMALVISIRSKGTVYSTFALPLATWIFLPFVSYASLRFGENGLDVYKSLRPLYLALVDPDSTENLRHTREKLSQDITQLINTYGLKLFDDFNPETMFDETSSARSTMAELAEGAKTFSRRATSFLNTTAIEWLDDRTLFNWSKESSASDDDGLYFLDKNSSGLSAPCSDNETWTPRRG